MKDVTQCCRFQGSRPGQRTAICGRLTEQHIPVLRLAAFGLTLFVLLGAASMAQQAPAASSSQPQTQAANTIAAIVEREVGMSERLLVGAAEAMPEDKFNFTPASLNIAGSQYKGVRTFAEIVKHVAAVNYAMWAPLTGEKMPANLAGNNPAADLTTKAQIVQLLKDSFALGHRAAGTLTATNATEQIPLRNSMSSRLYLATFAIIHCGDEYGQMVEYLRMNGIVPPASR